MGACLCKRSKAATSNHIAVENDVPQLAKHSVKSASEKNSDSLPSPAVLSSTSQGTDRRKLTINSTPVRPKPPESTRLVKFRSQSDAFAEFILAGGKIWDLIDNNRPPKGWNERLIRSNPVHCVSLQTGDNQSLYEVIIHVNDEDLSTKRSFLAFYQIQLHKMDPQHFVDWCRSNEMYNTVADYIPLYIASRYHGQGSICLRGLANDKHALQIKMSDRFVTPTGVFRAIVFQARTLPAVWRLVNTYLQRLNPNDYRRVRCALPDPRDYYA